VKINISPKITFILSILICIVSFTFFTYKGLVAYLVHKELYGGGIDALVASRWGLAFVSLIFAFLFYLFWRIKDLKSKKTILKGCSLGWLLVSILIPILAPDNIYIIIFPIIMVLISIISAYSLNQEIKEEKYKLTEKEIYLLQKLAGKK
tara:strand:- start:113 stop:562 length:450 start_codon:yes stop_codon:yes gene_type:complete